MKIYLATFDDGRGWQPMERAMSASKQRLCAYDTYDSAARAIRNIKYRYKDGTVFKIVTFGEIENG